MASKLSPQTSECISVDVVKPQDTDEGRKRKKMASKKSLCASKKRKWTWTNDKVEALLSYLREYKTKCGFYGVGFEADLHD